MSDNGLDLSETPVQALATRFGWLGVQVTQFDNNATESKLASVEALEKLKYVIPEIQGQLAGIAGIQEKLGGNLRTLTWWASFVIVGWYLAVPLAMAGGAIWLLW